MEKSTLGEGTNYGKSHTQKGKDRRYVAEFNKNAGDRGISEDGN